MHKKCPVTNITAWITHAPCFHGPISPTAKDLDTSAHETAGSVGLRARTTALQRNYLAENLGPVTACSLLIKGSSRDQILSCSLSTARFENPSALRRLTWKEERLKEKNTMKESEGFRMCSACTIP